MSVPLTRWFRRPDGRPRVWAVALLAGLAYLGWHGGVYLWARGERARAERAVAGYDFAEARRRLDGCLRARPDDPGLRLLAARTARRGGDLAAARQHLDAYAALVPETDPHLALERQLLTAQGGGVHEVLAGLIEAVEIHHPQTELILEALAMGCAHNYEFNQSMFWVEELAQRAPANAIGRLLRATTVDTQGRREQAVGLLRELVAEYPMYADARLSLASVLYKSQRYREAIPEYAALREQRPDDLTPLLGLASSYHRLGEPDAARPLMAELRERFPDSSEALLECGRFAVAHQDPAAAEPLLRRAVELAPFDHEAHREYAACLEQLGRRAEAREHLERSKQIEADLVLLEKAFGEVTKNPNDPAPRRAAGELCLRNGQTPEGLRWLYGALDLAPADKPTHLALAAYWASTGDVRRADAHRRQAGLVFGPPR